MSPHFTDISVIILLAALTAIFSSKVKQLPMIGYVITGIIIGPAFLGLVENEKNISFMAELGVVLLLFILGMELQLKSFRLSYKAALATTFGLLALSMAITFGIGFIVELSTQEKIAYGFIISLSSTAVAVKLMEDLDILGKSVGQVVISVLIAQDILFVPMIMIISAMSATGGFNFAFLPKILVAIIILIALVAFLSRKQKVHLLFHETVEKHKDLIPVAALAWCFAGAGLSEYFGLSPAYGAFLAGLIIGNSHSKNVVLPRIEPMQSVMLMVFFLSIGMLIDFKVLADNFYLIAALLAGVIIFKTIACIVLLRSFLPESRWRCSFVTGLTICQLGEFSFILAASAFSNGIFDNDSYKIIIAVIALSLAISPIWLSLLKRFVEIVYAERSSSSLGAALEQLFARKKSSQPSG